MKASNDTDSINNKFSNELEGLKPGSKDDSAMLDEQFDFVGPLTSVPLSDLVNGKPLPQFMDKQEGK